MSTNRGALVRLIICVDGVEASSDGKSGSANTSNVFKLQGFVSTGSCQGKDEQPFSQIVKYYQAADDNVNILDKLKTKAIGDVKDQIRDITKDIYRTLESQQDEIWLYGFGRGAHIVRTIAGILHHMGVPSKQSMDRFDDLFQTVLDLYKARSEDDGRNGPKILQRLQSHAGLPPRTRFVGLFDSVKSTPDKHLQSTSLPASINHFRHAMAINETRPTLAPDLVALPLTGEMEGRSFVQAWFVGTHQDIGGGSEHDGLSLYPLQWMILESMKVGLVFNFNAMGESTTAADSCLALTFPQFRAGGVPSFDGSEGAEWRFQYVNGIQISMFDVQSSHVVGQTASKNTHTVRLGPENSLYRTPREVFNYTGLVGWSANNGFGTVIHPSVFCLLDQYPRIQGNPRLRTYKEALANFQERCMKDEGQTLPPWLQGSELQESGVKAFRILVCGKTGVGKSTLINKVFGVEMTEESKTYEQGKHDINQAFESPKHPGLLIHDSRGWQAGSDEELDLIAKFLRHRAFLKDPAEALHVIWFCVDSDVSRIEEADKRTFETIAQFSHHVPVFVIGTKKDKLIAYQKFQLLEDFMKKTEGDFYEASRLANEEADRLAEEQFAGLRDQLSQIKHYKADGYCCLSKDDDAGVKKLLNQTVGLITDERVRLFCVAAQVVDIDQKINAAITECMRLGVHAVRTAMVPLPLSGVIGTPTVSRILCEHIIQCFGFPKVTPAEVDDIMKRVVLGNLKAYMTVTLTHFLASAAIAGGLAAATLGVASVVGLLQCCLAAPPTARMLLKCACDMILILERSFRYGGKLVSTRQIEDAAKYYATTTVTTFAGNEKRLQDHVHEEIDKLLPLRKIQIGFRFTKIRTDFEEIIYKNRFSPANNEDIMPLGKGAELDGGSDTAVFELDSQSKPAEMDGKSHFATELEGGAISLSSTRTGKSSSMSSLVSPATAGSIWSADSRVRSSEPSTLGGISEIGDGVEKISIGPDKPGLLRGATTRAEMTGDSTSATPAESSKWKKRMSRFALKKSKTHI